MEKRTNGSLSVRARLFAACCAILLTMLILKTGAAAQSISERKEQLEAQGFPEDYAIPLAVLQNQHPLWEFELLDVTRISREEGENFTWEEALRRECEEDAERSLVNADAALAAYHNETNSALYDSGWRQASRAAVAYFMDARNFLNEENIFQFLSLSFSESVATSALQTALHGTFMEKLVLENGELLPDFLLRLGQEFNINPLHLAARLRQEQGADGNVLSSGTAGNALWRWYRQSIPSENGKTIRPPKSGYSEDGLKKYNGLYNFFNVKASGNGYFAICLSGAEAAREGNAEMAESWGGNGAWTTRWKSIYGGAKRLAEKYISRHQNTLYLQKWNVDARSRDENGKSRAFSAQYMQNIGGAFSDGQTIFTVLSQSACLDLPHRFIIPVYEEMPSLPSADPAGGECEKYRAGICVTALPKESVPENTEQAENTAPPESAAPVLAEKPESTKKPPFYLLLLSTAGLFLLGSAFIISYSCFIVLIFSSDRMKGKKRNAQAHPR